MFSTAETKAEALIAELPAGERRAGWSESVASTSPQITRTSDSSNHKKDANPHPGNESAPLNGSGG